jgi:hypothetical protein
VNPHDEQVLPALAHKNRQNYENLPLDTNEKRKEMIIEVNQSVVQEQEAEQELSSRKDLADLKPLTDRDGEI